MWRGSRRLTCWVVGVLFVAAGALTAVFGEPADQHHNLLHLATGLVALVAGVVPRPVGGAEVLRCVRRRLSGLRGARLPAGRPTGRPPVERGSSAAGCGRACLPPRPRWCGPRGRAVHGAATLRTTTSTDPAPAPGPSSVACLCCRRRRGNDGDLGRHLHHGRPARPAHPAHPGRSCCRRRWRWASVLAGIAALFIVVGYISSGAVGQLFDPVASGAFAGLWLQFGGASVTVVAGAVAVVRTYRAAPKEAAGVTGRTGG